jgi:ubiquinone/menaquinone biosynthesis C-methylase UbiE
MSSQEVKKYTEANREAWNEVMPMHQKAAKERWDKAFLQPGFVGLAQKEVDLLNKIGIEGKAVAHLCCNNGIELLSMKNLGAGECVGFDISDLAVDEARERAELTGIDCQYVRTDLYEIGREYENRFDLVYLTAGALGWMPDIKLLFAKAKKLLKENGQIFIHEIHPFSEMLPFDEKNDHRTPNELLRIIEPYFKRDPYIDYGGLDYVGGAQYDSTKPQYWFVHTISDIMGALIENKISLEYFSESDKDISGGHQQIEALQFGIPLSYLLIARKEA